MSSTHYVQFQIAQQADLIRQASEFRLASELIKLGTEIRSRRRAWAMSQRHLAILADTTQSCVAQIEAGQGNPSLSLLMRVVHALPNATLQLQIRHNYNLR